MKDPNEFISAIMAFQKAAQPVRIDGKPVTGWLITAESEEGMECRGCGATMKVLRDCYVVGFGNEADIKAWIRSFERSRRYPILSNGASFVAMFMEGKAHRIRRGFSFFMLRFERNLQFGKRLGNHGAMPAEVMQEHDDLLLAAAALREQSDVTPEHHTQASALVKRADALRAKHLKGQNAPRDGEVI